MAIECLARQTSKGHAMNIRMNRWLDTLASIAIVVIGLALGGATAIVGA